MEARHEPRFPIYGPVKVTRLSIPDRVLDCVLTEVSATGLKIIVPESFDADEIIAIEAEDHLALADVRYSQSRGDKFTVGCERIHVLNKIALPDEQAKLDQVRLLVEDYRNRISGGIATPRPDADKAEAERLEHAIGEKCGPAEPPVAPPPGNLAPIPPPPASPQSPPNAGQFATREQLLDAAGAWVVENWDKTQTPDAPPSGKSEIVDRLTVHLAEKLRPQAPPPPVAPVAEPIPVKAAPKPRKKISLRRWRIPAGLAAAALLGWGLSAVFWSLGSSGAAKQIQSSIAALVTPKEKPEAVAAPVSGIRHAIIKATETTWVMLTVDGKRILNKKMLVNDAKEFDFSAKATVRVGNAKGLEITLDGKPVGPLGNRGQPRSVELSAAGFRFLPIN